MNAAGHGARAGEASCGPNSYVCSPKQGYPASDSVSVLNLKAVFEAANRLSVGIGNRFKVKNE